MTANGSDRYDPTGEAAIWQAASGLVASLKSDSLSVDWNAALEQASRALENEARGIRQTTGGMYYRGISGSKHEPHSD
jgi:hypothetical protein